MPFVTIPFARPKSNCISELLFQSCTELLRHLHKSRCCSSKWHDRSDLCLSSLILRPHGRSQILSSGSHMKMPPLRKWHRGRSKKFDGFLEVLFPLFYSAFRAREVLRNCLVTCHRFCWRGCVCDSFSLPYHVMTDGHAVGSTSCDGLLVRSACSLIITAVASVQLGRLCPSLSS